MEDRHAVRSRPGRHGHTEDRAASCWHVIQRRDIWRRHAFGDIHLEPARLRSGQRFTAALCAVEPLADIALLGEPDGQTVPDARDSWGDAIADVAPAPICLDDFPLFTPFRVHLWSHDRGWIAAQASQRVLRGDLALRTTAPIHGGTSGGPVVTDDGRVLGVVSASLSGPDDRPGPDG
jgi:hypothetical protein